MKTTTLTIGGRIVAAMMTFAGFSGAAEIHVAPTGTDTNAGTALEPMRTIQRAADLARPGDTITVHAGTYRERVNPPRGGESDTKRITYRSAPGEKVEIKGSEPIKGWVKAQHDTWKVTLPNRFFGTFNPYDDDHLIKGGWFEDKGKKHHPGAVYLNGDWLLEADSLDDVMKPVDKTPLWFGEVKGSSTTIWAQFKGVDPNAQEVEINVRQTVFYPGLPGRNYITVRGFILRHAATPWAPPAVEQIGLIGPHWSRGWIIEDNIISHSACVGISLGKYGDGLDQTAYKEWFTGSVKRALADGWSRDAIGHHIVRHNHISHCEQAGIVGSLGCAFSTVAGNTIHDIHVRRRFNGAEMAALKFHGAIDVVITGNHVYRSEMGIWLDWMAQGARVSGNLLHNNRFGDLHMEVNHGPYVIDNNLFLSPASSRVYNVSQGGAYVHNLFGGSLLRFVANGKRSTPYHQPHATEIVDMPAIVGGDDRFYNNLFVKTQLLANYEKPMPSQFAGNVYLGVAKAHWEEERTPLVVPEYDAKTLRLEQRADGWYLALTFDPTWIAARRRPLVTSELLGKAKVPNATYENPDGSPLRVTTDYHGKRRDESNPTPGPFERPGGGALLIKVR
jgi:alpha-N-arabinofuranosidase